MEGQAEVAHNLDRLRQFGPAPFWFLNGDLNEEALQADLLELRDKGVFSVVLHPRSGMEVEYLSEPYWEKIGFILGTCRELGMRAWLYDEYNWPSGAAGGKLQRDHPEYLQTYLDYHIHEARPNREINIPLKGQTLWATAVHLASGEVRPLEIPTYTTKLRWRTPEPGWSIVVCFVRRCSEVFMNTACAPGMKGESGYLDLLNRRAVAHFIAITHEEYALRFGDYFGNTVPGLFTGEPANYQGLPWTGCFLERFRETKGYDLKPRLHELAVDVGQFVITRLDYHEVATRLYEEAFFVQLHDWCERHGLLFTGHLFQEKLLETLPATQGALFPLLRHMHMPGIDFLGARTGYVGHLLDDGGGVNLVAKSLSSTAHATGAERTLCECFGGTGWKTSLAQLFAVANWASACGINFFNPHAVFESLKGLRKRDFPPSHFVPEPWWPYYGQFSEMIARQSEAAGAGMHVADLLVVYPMRTFWAGHTLYGLSKQYRDLKTSFLAIVNGLLRIQRDYDLLFEETAEEGRVEVTEDRLCIRQETYKALLLPPSFVMTRAVALLTRRFYENGGLVIALGRLPTGSEAGAGDAEMAEIVASVFGRPEGIAQAHPRERRVVRRNDRGGRAVFVPLNEPLDLETAIDLLPPVLDEWLPRDVAIEGPLAANFVVLHRRVAGQEHFFVANLGEVDAQATIGLAATGDVTCWGPTEPQPVPAPVYHCESGRTVIPWSFAAGQGVWFQVDPNRAPAMHVEETNLSVVHVSAEAGQVVIEGCSRERQPYVVIDGTRHVFLTGNPSEETTPQEGPAHGSALPPILLASEWSITPSSPNTFSLGPWMAAILDAGEQRTTGGPSEAEYSEFLPRRARLMLGAANVANKARTLAQGGRVKMVSSSYTPAGELIEASHAIVKRLGVNLQGISAYQTMSILNVAAADTGLLPPALPPGARYAIETRFEVVQLPEHVDLVYEDLGEPVSITINGVRVTDAPQPVYVWDRCNRAISADHYLKTGHNELRMESRVPDYPDMGLVRHGIEPVMLYGSFGVQDGKIGALQKTTTDGDWSNSGFPHYSGEMLYGQRFELPERYLGKRLMLEFPDVRETIEVWLNGRSSGARLCPPFVFDISEAAVAGENRLELRIRNTAENLLRGPFPSGILCPVRIVPYDRHRLMLPAAS